MEILNQLRKATLDCFEIDNNFIPDEFVDKRGLKQGRTSLAFVNRKAREKGLIESEHKELKALKAANVELYRKQLEAAGSFEYNVNEEKLTCNEICFYNLMDSAGHFEEENEE
jgi:hypothetical protein